MKKYLLAAAAVLALGGSANANMVDAQNPWLLIGLQWENGDGYYARGDLAVDALGAAPWSQPGVSPSPVPAFATRDECYAAERHILAKYKNVSHAAGGLGYYLCVPQSAFASPPWTRG